MYLQNLKTHAPLPFVYSIHYDPTTYAIRFSINPSCIQIFQNVNPENLQLRYCLEKLGFSNFESNLEKNFGFDNCSVNHGIVNGLLTISFPVKAFFTLAEQNCAACRGEKKNWKDDLCYFCRGTGKEFKEKTNGESVSASLYLLTRYLNWFCLRNEKTPILENKWGNQDIFLELQPRAGIGGECSPLFFSTIAKLPDMDIQRRRDMLDLYLYMEGREQFPKVNFCITEHQFRNEVGEKGKFYIEVAGQNGCSIHMAHNSDSEFTCHNVDTPQQHLSLIAGFASIAGSFFESL